MTSLRNVKGLAHRWLLETLVAALGILDRGIISSELESASRLDDGSTAA